MTTLILWGGELVNLFGHSEQWQKRLRGTNPSSQERLMWSGWAFRSPAKPSCVTGDLWMLLVMLLVYTTGPNAQLVFRMCL